MIGERLGHYRVLEKIGAGGMGVVYRAHDETLDRDVALKVLPGEALADEAARARFRKEALALSQLNHPHICTIYEVGEAGGQAYIAMEYIAGRTLSAVVREEGLTPQTAVRYGMQIAEALAHAHERGVVHRDLKSSNVIITPEGRAKVLDFGLAKRLREAEAAEATRSQGTETGTVVGTLAYMAPEVLSGEPADARSDVWALGVMLYEMAAGELPFQGKTGFELSAAILRGAPEALSAGAPAGLSAVIERCLAKKPGERYQRAGEVRAALEAMGTGRGKPEAYPTWLQIVAAAVVLFGALGWLVARRGTGKIESIAVLPLENLSGDPSQDYFADGMTEELTASLAKIGALKVISRTSVMKYKGARKPLPEIGRELGVDAVVEGSVRRSGERVRITAQLIQAKTDKHLWAESYERDVRDVLQLQSEVSRAIADQIRVKLTPQEQVRLAGGRAVQPEAYDLYLRGKFHSARENLEENQAAIATLERAVEIDPGFALGYAELARAYGIRAFYFEPKDKQWEEKGFVAAEKALALDPNSWDAHLARGLILWRPFNHFPHEEAIREYKRAVELNANADEAHHQLGLVYLHVGLLEKGMQEVQTAVSLNPGNNLARFRVAVALLYMGKDEQALAAFEAVPPGINPALWGYQAAWAMSHLGRRQEAAERIEDFLKKSPQDEGGVLAGMKAILLAKAGDRSGAEKIIRRAAEKKGYGHFHHTAYSIGAAYSLMNQAGPAVEWLRASAEDGFPNYPLFERDPDLNGIRGDPRFVALMAKLKAQWERRRGAL
ncbi:MAG: protein kinase [Acidobacteria bacterium]|nr:protein kinase [Acidobacteriota bacterium]